MSVSLRRPQRSLGRSVPSNGAAPAVALRDVQKVYGRGDAGGVVPLDGISIDFAAGSFTAIMGPSGSARARSCTWRPAWTGRPPVRSCSVDTELTRLSERGLTILRRERIGFIFQAFNLMPSLTVARNIGLPLRLDGRRARRSEVGEGGGAGRSGQASATPSLRAVRRTAATRRHRPSAGHAARGVVFADEPTGALDTGTGRAVLGLLRELVDVEGAHGRHGYARPRGRGLRGSGDPARRRAHCRGARRCHCRRSRRAPGAPGGLSRASHGNPGRRAAGSDFSSARCWR